MRAAPFFLAILILMGGVFAAFQNVNTLAEVEGEPTQRPTVTPRPRPTAPPTPTLRMVVGAPATPEPAAQATETPRPAPTVAAGDQQIATVANTGGAGVYLRRTPRMADTIRPYVEGTQMAVMGPPVSAEGRTWLHVRAPDGTVGYIPEQWARVSRLPAGAPPSVWTPVPSPTPGPPRATQTPRPTATPQVVATPEASGGEVLRVGNTGGEGVFIRRSPNMADRIRPWMDGTPMEVVGPEVQGDGQTWAQVRAPDGTVGYIPRQYLVGG